MKVFHLECGSFDHKPMIIHQAGIPIRKQKPWRFEQVWLKDEGCHSTIKNAWQSNLHSLSPMTVVEKNLEDFQSKLWVWSKFSFGNITRNLV